MLHSEDILEPQLLAWQAYTQNQGTNGWGKKPSYQQEMNEEGDHRTTLSVPPYLLFSLPQQQKKKGKKALK
jgi:hypothetical protein